MDYEKKYKELILWGFIDDISDEYPECNDFEKIVLALTFVARYSATLQAIATPS